jgi:6-phosphogluconolactonase
LLPIKADGSLGEAVAFDQHKGSSVNRERQGEPHAHSADFSPDNRYAFVSDLGVDRVYVYRFDATKGTLTANEPGFGKLPPGSGPRHFVLHPNGKFAYVISEMGGIVTAFTWEPAKGALNALETYSALAGNPPGDKDAAEVAVHENGKFVYASLRGKSNLITLFDVAAGGAQLKRVDSFPSGGRTPRNFTIDPTGAWIFSANEGSDSIVLFRIDPNTGKLTQTAEKLEAGSPVCVRFLKAE